MCRRPCGDVQAAMWWGGGPCDFSVSPSPFGLDFGTLDFGTSDAGGGRGLPNFLPFLFFFVKEFFPGPKCCELRQKQCNFDFSLFFIGLV